MFGFIFRVIRYAFLAVLGAAVAAKFLLESHASPETEEIDLVSILEGKQLVSTADPFYGGKFLAIFSGTLLDLRRVTPSPTGIRLDVAMAMAGLSIIVPEGWRVRSEMNVTMGGFADNTRTTADPDAATVVLTGFVLMGGVQVTTKSPVEAVA